MIFFPFYDLSKKQTNFNGLPRPNRPPRIECLVQLHVQVELVGRQPLRTLPLVTLACFRAALVEDVLVEVGMAFADIDAVILNFGNFLFNFCSLKP